MAVSLSAYWVKFFIGAGFPQDVATKHAVVFSNNRIHPDMLPELDKPSLKDMGITLMGDMIAILRYAKKVVEETTCEKFLVDSEGSIVSKITSKPVLKKPLGKMITRSTVTTPKVKTEPQNAVRITKTSTDTPNASTVLAKKKPVPTAKVISHYIEKPKPQVTLKRKLNNASDDYQSDASNEDWNNDSSKKVATEDEVGYKVIMPKGTTLRSRKILKKALDQKRTVFDRLGDSSVTSTTNIVSETAATTFNVTGLGKEVFKRNSSVFNRLGDKDSKKDQLPYVGILKNGTSNTAATPGILKNSPTKVGNRILTTKKIFKVGGKPNGTMRADQEKKQKIIVGKTKQIVKLNKKITFNTTPGTTKVIRKIATSSKLASEQVSPLSAKARLGMTNSLPVKQVTFNKTATVTRITKPGVFSRLGV